MNDEEIKQILNDPKKLLDMFRVFHRLIHIYEAQETLNLRKEKSNEQLGMSDELEVKLIKSESTKLQEAKQ
jgi:hypothetical protein